MTPDETLKTEQNTNSKYDKALITINFASKVTWSHKLEH